MPNKKDNESQDTLKFKVPHAARPVSDETKIYSVPKSQSGRRISSSDTDNRRENGSQRYRQYQQRQQTRRPSSQSVNDSPLGNIQRMPSGSQAQRNASRPGSSLGSNDQRQYNNNHIQGNAPRQRTEPPQARTPNAEREPVRRQPHTAVKRRKNPFASFIVKLIWIAVIIFLLYSSLALYYISKVTPIEKSTQYQNNESQLMYSSQVKNILVIGTDARDSSVRGLSDSMILLSIDKKDKKIFMTSFMRDMYTPIEGYGSEKMNAAYSYGGAPLLIDTIEDNFKIRIDGCMTVNFTSVAYVVDAVGGVKVTISDSEAEAINTILCSEVNEIMGDDKNSDFLPSGGTYTLDGKQALSYSRIRYVGDADFERTQRQRTVINQVMKNMKKVNPVRLNKNIKKALPYIGSDMSSLDMYLLSLRVPSLLIGYDLEQMRVPADGTWSYDETDDGQSILGVDFAANTQILKDKIYMDD